MREIQCYEVNFDMCSYGEPFKKDAKIFTSAACSQQLERHCNHRRHSVWLKGQLKVETADGSTVYKNRTSLAGAYPKQLCDKYASLVTSNRLCFSHGEGDQFIQDHWSAAVRDYTPKSARARHLTPSSLQARCDFEEEPQLELIQQKGGLSEFFDFIALGREPKKAWEFLKKNKQKPFSC